MVGIARGADEIHDVILHLVVHVDVIDDLAGVEDLFGLYYRGRGWRAGSFGHGLENLPLLGARGIADFQFQHEAVDLRFGQRISAFLLDRVLRGEHEKRFDPI